MKSGFSQLTWQWVFTITLTLYGMSVADVTLTTFGRNVNNYIMLCPEDDYVLVFQCVVTDSLQFQWSLIPLIGRIPFGQQNEVGKRTEPDVTLVLTEKEVTEQSSFYESQLQVSTVSLIEQLFINHDQLEVFCGTSDEPKNKFIWLSGMNGDPPKILNALINETTNEIFVKWVTDISNLVNITVIANNTVTGEVYSAVVEWNDDEAYINICNPADTFSVTVVAFDDCQRFSSNTTILHGSASKSTMESMTPSMMLCTMSTMPILSTSNLPSTLSDCENSTNEGALIALGVFLGLTVMMIIFLVALFVIMFLYGKRGEHAEKSRKLSPVENDDSKL